MAVRHWDNESIGIKMQLQQEITEQIHHVLQAEGVDIAVQDNLIEHGLHSLAIMQLVDTFEKKYNKQLSYIDFAMSPTVEDWVGILNQTDSINQLGRDQLDPLQAPILTLDLPTAPVALSEMQYAYWAGRQTEGVSAHLYMEFTGENLDILKLQQAYQQLVQRHPMLNASIANGQQSIQSLAHDHIHIEDLTRLAENQIQQQLQRKRQIISHQQLDIQNGQVIDIQLTLLPNNRHVLHIDTDMIAIDPQSFLIVVEDLTAFYLGKELASLSTSSIQYFDYLQSRSNDQNYHTRTIRDQQWWQQRLGDIPPSPDLPLIPEGLRVDSNTFERLIHNFSEFEKNQLQNLSHTHGISVQSLCLTLFAETMATWSASSEFRLNLPSFIREPYDPNIGHVVGDFTNLSLLNIKLNSEDTLLEAAKCIENEVDLISEHYTYGGIHILRDLSKRNQQLEISPIVFTSTLDVGEIFSEELQQALGQPIWCISQGPKVDLDVQIAYFNQGLTINWDIRTHAFKPNVIQAMFSHYIEAIQTLINGGVRSISSKLQYQLPAQQSELRQAKLSQNKTNKLPASILAQFPFIDVQTEYRIVNALNTDCPNWVIGQLWLKIEDQKQTLTDSVHLKTIESGKWIDSGYYAYFNDQAEIHVYSNKNQLIKKNGYWIDVKDIAQKIMSLPNIVDANVYAIHEGEQKGLVVLIKHEQGKSIQYADLYLAYTTVLPQYLIPENSYLVDCLDEKIDGENLKYFIQTNKSLEQLSLQQCDLVTSLEKVVCFIMSKIIGLPEQDIDVTMDFFDQGGDSLLATHFVAALNQYFKDCQISVVDIFSQRTAKNIAMMIEKNIPQSAHQIAEVFLKVIEGKK